MEPPVITYTDELQADGSVRRNYSNGVFEWRRRLPGGRIEWENSLGQAGVDEALNAEVIKRTLRDGQVFYGREQGYGRTAWGGSDRMVTVNKSSFGGKVGAILAGIGAAALMGGIIWPPDSLSADEEEALRQQAHAAGSGNGSGGDGGWDSSDDSDGWGSDFG
jgi:hypothetical protein